LRDDAASILRAIAYKARSDLLWHPRQTVSSLLALRYRERCLRSLTIIRNLGTSYLHHGSSDIFKLQHSPIYIQSWTKSACRDAGTGVLGTVILSEARIADRNGTCYRASSAQVSRGLRLACVAACSCAALAGAAVTQGARSMSARVFRCASGTDCAAGAAPTCTFARLLLVSLTGQPHARSSLRSVTASLRRAIRLPHCLMLTSEFSHDSSCLVS
jgi:hypothetical protein